MVIRMRHTKAHTRNRRSHHALKSPHLVACENCGVMKQRHKMCLECGTYKGKVVIDVVAKQTKKQAKLKARQES